MTPKHLEDNLHTDRAFVNKKHEMLIQSVIAVIYTFPFAMNAFELHQTMDDSHLPHPLIIVLQILNGLAPISILSIGYHLYGKHTYAVLSGEDIRALESHMQPIKTHLESNQNQSTSESFNLSTSLLKDTEQGSTNKSEGSSIRQPPFTRFQKGLLLLVLTAVTFPLGWTKSYALSNVLGQAARIPWLGVYSLIDAAPHINHLDYYQDANQLVTERLNQQAYLKIVSVLLLMIGHAAEDMIDFDNTQQTLLNLSPTVFKCWLGLGIAAEMLSAYVESVVHSEDAHAHHHNASTCATLTPRVIIVLGQMATAAYNLITTLDEHPEAMQSPQMLPFILLSFLGYAFIGWETIHHLNHDHNDHEDHQPCGGHNHPTSNKSTGKPCDDNSVCCNSPALFNPLNEIYCGECTTPPPGTTPDKLNFC